MTAKSAESNATGFLRKAIKLATKNTNPAPNPRVGAVVVRAGKIVGAGFHAAAGGPHAEIVALRRAGERAVGATLFVTLEPCHHVGRTAPCTRTILAAGITKVVIGMRDPNPIAAGGAEFLRKKGLLVTFSDLKKECEQLNRVWLKNITTGLPFITLKLALDERGSSIAAAGRKWITNTKSRRKVMRLRRDFDAIAVGWRTIAADDPRLTVRGLKVAKQPLRLVFDPRERTPKSAKVLNDGGETLLISKRSFPDFRLKPILRQLLQRGIRSIFLEGGEKTAEKFLAEKLVDEVFIFQRNAVGVPRVCGRKLPLKKVGKFDGDTFFHTVLGKL